MGLGEMEQNPANRASPGMTT